MFYLYIFIVAACGFGIGWLLASTKTPKQSPLVKKENLQKTPTENGEYFVGSIQDGGITDNVMFTLKEVERATKRAAKNTQDFIR